VAEDHEGEVVPHQLAHELPASAVPVEDAAEHAVLHAKPLEKIPIQVSQSINTRKKERNSTGWVDQARTDYIAK